MLAVIKSQVSLTSKNATIVMQKLSKRVGDTSSCT